MSLAHYRTLGRSGLVVSPLCLGTMTFGTARWGSGEEGSGAVFDAYVEQGGNFIDTADVYSSGRSEEMVGRFVAARALRDQMVIATKAGFSAGQGPHGGGNGAKHIHAPAPHARGAVSGSPGGSQGRPVEPGEDRLTGFVFKVQANMDPNHRDRVAFVRLCSGKLVKGMRLKQVRTGKQVPVNAPLFFFAKERQVAEEAGQSPARVALAWVMGRPGVTSTLMGVSRAEQVTDNIAALDVALSEEHRAVLDAASAPEPRMPYPLFTPAMRQQVVFGGSPVEPWRA